MYPKVSIIWINYNSSKIMDVVLESLEYALSLDYPNYELIVIDNASNDGSFENIKEFLKNYSNGSSPKVRIVRLSRNIGFTGGCNIGFKIALRDSKYVALLNNDAVPYPDSLINLVECMEADPTLGAAQGIILKYGTDRVDTAGDFIDEMLITHKLFHNHEYPCMRREIEVTYADGAYSIIRVDAVKKSVGPRLFDGDMFAYYDDMVLGLKLWNHGYRVVGFPFKTASHLVNGSFGKSLLKLYLGIKARAVLNEVSNSRFKEVIRAKLIATALALKLSPIKRTNVKVPELTDVGVRTYIKAIYDGIKLGVKKRLSGEFIDLYRAPIIKIDGDKVTYLILRNKWIMEHVYGKLSMIENLLKHAPLEKRKYEYARLLKVLATN